MTDRALANAEKRRDELAARINQTNQRLADLRKELMATETFIADWHRYADTEPGRTAHTQDSDYPQGVHEDVKSAVGIGLARGVVPIGGGVAAQGVTGGDGDAGFHLDPTPPVRKNPDRSTVGAHVKQILTEFGRPVLRQELYKALADRGIIIQGKDPEMVLSTMMWRMPNVFVRLPRHGYWFRDVPWADANYNPDDGAEPGVDADVVENMIRDPASVQES